MSQDAPKLTPNQRAIINSATALSVLLLVVGVLVVAGSPPIGLGLCVLAVAVLLCARVAGWSLQSRSDS